MEAMTKPFWGFEDVYPIEEAEAGDPDGNNLPEITAPDLQNELKELKEVIREARAAVVAFREVIGEARRGIPSQSV